MAVRTISMALLTCGALAAVPGDEVLSLPGFPPGPFPFKAYSGFLDVQFSPAINGYDGATIHYQFHTSQRNSSDPVVAWHTGGPGGSSIYGQYAEVGYWQVSASAGQTVNKHAWNNVAHMLYLESPAGSFLTPVDQHSGFSYCTKAGVKQTKCHWDDVTQAQAYGHTLQAFFAAFPEFARNPLYLAGESYAGQYIPNIAAHLLANVPALPLKGIAVGNGCWGGDASSVQCNGPNDQQNDVEFYHGKGLMSTRLYREIMATCPWPKVSLPCERLLAQMDKAVGPHNVYNIYDNCPNLDATTGGKLSMRTWFQRSGKSPRWLRSFLANNLVNPSAYQQLEALAEVGVGGGQLGGAAGNPASGGGYDWTCGQFDAIPPYFKRADVRKALHLPNDKETGSSFSYTSSGPASVTLYPKLVDKIRVLIYNGDSDTCVPYIGNEEWTTGLAEANVVTETAPWHPWFESPSSSSPAGYATTYSAGNHTDFSFVTLRLSGHQAPKNMPGAAFTMIATFLGGSTL